MRAWDTHTYVFTHIKLVGLTSSPLRGLTHVPCRLLMVGVHRAPMSRLRTTISSRGLDSTLRNTPVLAIDRLPKYCWLEGHLHHLDLGPLTVHPEGLLPPLIY